MQRFWIYVIFATAIILVIGHLWLLIPAEHTCTSVLDVKEAKDEAARARGRNPERSRSKPVALRRGAESTSDAVIDVLETNSILPVRDVDLKTESRKTDQWDLYADYQPDDYMSGKPSSPPTADGSFRDVSQIDEEATGAVIHADPTDAVAPAVADAISSADGIAPIKADATSAVKSDVIVAPPSGIGGSIPTFTGGYTPHSFPMAMVAFNRPDYLRRALSSLRDNVRYFKPDLLTVYQDGNDPAVSAVAAEYPGVTWIHHDRTYQREGAGYIAAQYRFLMGDMFERHPDSEYIILIEDDMIFSADFLLYFAQLATVPDSDPSVWCVSSWNDNGFKEHAHDSTALYRTDFFVGLGWLMPRRIWNEVRHGWPNTHWDHWMRHPQQRKGRQCIYPEISRHYNIGEKGTHSTGSMYEKYFRSTVMPDEAASYDLGDVGRLQSDRYRQWIESRIANARQNADLSELRQDSTDQRDVLVYITMPSDMDETAWSAISAFFRLWHSTPIRGMYSGVQVFWFHGRYVLLVGSWSPFAPRNLIPRSPREFIT